MCGGTALLRNCSQPQANFRVRRTRGRVHLLRRREPGLALVLRPASHMRSAICAGLALLAAGGVAASAGDPSEVLVGRVARHVVLKGETLRSIGAQFGVDATTLAGENGIRRSAVLRAGQELTIDNRHIVPTAVGAGPIIVNIPQRMLFWRAGERLLAAPVAVGSRGWATPVAPFRIVAMETDPTWDVPESIAIEARARGQRLPSKVPPGPANPLGRHWLGLSVGSIGIHGTNAPSSIYAAVTHGCIRMHAHDVALLFGSVAIGATGALIYEPILLAQEGGEVYLEVHPDIYGRTLTPPLHYARSLAGSKGLAGDIDWREAQRVLERRDGIARNVTAR